ncbi:hypothetical protein PN462_09605 [Spirulina sp. CS-785/01]|uniref:hypothetical protein n=1 Tax=Spirulina sp. CS-785/01 TaxID=3021716 RepID=UPI00232C2641|nr:hypothetical protein [Spirulina sp. CS-785/01]MDB9313353.1 hypothetical protein [Spirulina sp. CS-785/01]
MDEVVKKVAALGLPGVILVITMAATGLTGAAAITSALAFLGGPAGMLGGLAMLGITGLIADALAKVGLETLLLEIYRDRKNSESLSRLLNEIDRLPTSGELKQKLKTEVRR